MRSTILVAVVLFAGFVQSILQPAIDFPATGSAAAHAKFIQGIIALHNSAYEDAAEYFRAAEAADRGPGPFGEERKGIARGVLSDSRMTLSAPAKAASGSPYV